MSNYSKFSDINAVINKAEKSLKDIENQYNKYLEQKIIPDSLLVEVKDCLGNLRSALDYLWNKIPNSNGGYFPIANSLADFQNKVKAIDVTYQKTLEKWQDYDSNSWITSFNLFRNKNTHVTLIPQKRTETQRIVSEHVGGGSVSWDPNSVRFGSGVYINGAPVNPLTQMPITTPDATVRREIWVDFLFDGVSISPNFPQNVSVIPFLKKSLENVKNIITDIEPLIK
ncbi:MAG: hypothetical protein WC470_02220 [Candidatus Paceibacterota bacterium]